jgi:hypothetical protein
MTFKLESQLDMSGSLFWIAAEYKGGSMLTRDSGEAFFIRPGYNHAVIKDRQFVLRLGFHDTIHNLPRFDVFRIWSILYQRYLEVIPPAVMFE